jgi:hypothetical protein
MAVYINNEQVSQNRLTYQSLSCAKLAGFRDRHSKHQKHTDTQVMGERTYGGELALFRRQLLLFPEPCKASTVYKLISHVGVAIHVSHAKGTLYLWFV